MRRPSLSSVLRSILPTVVAIVLPAGAAFAAAPAAKTAPPAGAEAQPNYLPNDVVLARVGDHKVTVFAFRERYFSSDINFRPGQDSLGRVKFLTSMVQKEVLGQTALKAGYVLGFEDRAELRAFRNQIISNRLFETVVNGASRLPADSIDKVAGYYARLVRIRLLSFPTRQQAEYVRLQLVGGRLSWSAASEKYAAQGDSLQRGVTPWMNFGVLPIGIALQVWPLRVGETSQVIAGGPAYFLAQVAEENFPSGRQPTYIQRKLARSALRGLERSDNRRGIIDEAKQGMGIVYDTTAIVWTGSHFSAVRKNGSKGAFGLTMEIDASVPEFLPQDTSRVLVRWKDGVVTLGRMLHEWQDIQPVMRPTIVTFDQVADFIDSIVLENRLVQIAEQHGLGTDSLAVAMTDRKHEELVVTHMMQDSSLNAISVTREERLAYYKAHQNGFVTWARVRYAVFERPTQAAADSLLKRIRSGMPVELLVAQDHAHGITDSDTASVNESEATPYRKPLFEELHPGQSTTVATHGKFVVLKSLAYDPGHLLPFEQVEGPIDESIRNIKGDKALQDLIARLAKRFTIETHPELLMRIQMTDPISDQMFE